MKELSHDAICDLASQMQDLGAFRGEILRRLGTTVGFEAGLYQYSGAWAAIDERCVCGMDPAIIRQIQCHWERYTGGFMPVLELLAGARVVVDTDVMPMGVFESSDFYREIKRPHGWGATAYAHVQLHPQMAPAIITLTRGRRDRPFRTEEIDLLKRLLRTLSMADAALSRVTRDEIVTLDPTERELAEYVSLGYTNRQIAAALGKSIFTVRNRLVKLFAKCEVASRAELAYRFRRNLR